MKHVFSLIYSIGQVGEQEKLQWSNMLPVPSAASAKLMKREVTPDACCGNHTAWPYLYQ